MKVTLLLTSFNEERNVKDFFKHLKAQTRKPDEIILVDSSSDRTAKLAKRYVDKLIVTPTKNCGHGRKIGFEASTGDRIVLTDIDAIMPPDWLENLLKPFKEKNVHVVQGQVLYHSIGKEEDQMWSKKLAKKGKYANHCNIAYRRHVIEENPWDPNINLDDVEMGYRVSKKYVIYGNKDAKVWHYGALKENRIKQNINRTTLRYQVGWMQLIRKYKSPYWLARAMYNIFSLLLPGGDREHFLLQFKMFFVAFYKTFIKNEW